ncbi:DUF6193 family natural product biosynthesis protein [Streptomyces atratus]|uniref:DUF6193 family natural product biosynthesis protein n=1 Tax=Streptomyces atratus TaxID=1893 RepID=UPI0036637EA0
MDSDLYPDLAAAGSLAAALERAAADLGVDLVTVPGDWGSLVSAGIAASVPEREPLSVHIGAECRWFGFSGWSRGVELITGATSALEDVVWAGVAWGEGRSLRELQELLPFVHFTELAEAHERGPAPAVEVRWKPLDARLQRPHRHALPTRGRHRPASYEGLPYRVQKFPHGGVIAEAVTVEEAIALAVAHLPAGLGPAGAGTFNPDG